MKKRIFYSITGVTLVSVCVFSFLVSSIMYNQIFENEKENIQMEFLQIKNALLENEVQYNFENIFTSSRLTLIASDGTVLYDNRRDHTTMENHANRSEITALSTQNKAESTRLSATLGSQTYYYAEKLNDDVVLRISITIDSIYSIVVKTIPFIIAVAVCITVLSAFISSYLTKKIIAPLYNINEPLYDELDLFYQKIRGQDRFIKKQKRKLNQKKEEFKILTENIGDGFILLDDDNKIASINKKAVKIFNTKKSKGIKRDVLELSRNDGFIMAIQSAYEGNNSEITLEIHNKEYILHIAPVKNERKGIQKVVGVVIIAIDYTEKAQAERVRKEFSANVSHELKTPLTSILGYAELVKTGIAKPGDIQSFCEKIYHEATNLLKLIDDILKISRLDEMNDKYEREEVNLKNLIENIVSRLEIIAEKKHIAIHTNMEDLTLTGIPSILDETFYNIIENAIKYNVDKGEVSITLTMKESNIKVCVEDTGIGIPEDSIKRVFERFYRVDKSHSSSIKGTGLGLSIVKHAVHLHNGKIDLKSTLMKGTRVCVSFKVQ